MQQVCALLATLCFTRAAMAQLNTSTAWDESAADPAADDAPAVPTPPPAEPVRAAPPAGALPPLQPASQRDDVRDRQEVVDAGAWVPAYDSNRTDPLVLTGIALASMGMVGVISGAVIHETARGPDYCGLSGCFEVEHHPRRMQAIGLIGGGAATVITGGAVALAGLRAAPVERARRSEAMMVAGVGLTTGGIAGMMGGVSLLIADYGRHGLGTPHLLAAVASGAVGLGAGIPLWAVGARTRRGPPVGQLHIDGRGIAWSMTF
jgi:hypothetical protein